MSQVFTERSEIPLVTSNLCIIRRYNLGEGDLVSTLSVYIHVNHFFLE